VNAGFFAYFTNFVGLQVLALVALRWGSGGGGSMRDRCWWMGFLAVNAVGIPSVFLLKELYKALPNAPNR